MPCHLYMNGQHGTQAFSCTEPMPACEAQCTCLRLPPGLTAMACCLQCEGYMYKASQNRLRMRMYNVLKDIRRQHAFYPIVIRPSLSPDYRPRVNWANFHETVPLEKAPALYRASYVPRDMAEGSTNAVTPTNGPSGIHTCLM